MSNNSEPTADPVWDRYQDTDFADAKPVDQVPALARLQAEQGKTADVTMPVDRKVLATFKAQAEITGTSCEDLMGEALRQFAEGQTLADVVRATIREELHSR